MTTPHPGDAPAAQAGRDPRPHGSVPATQDGPPPHPANPREPVSRASLVIGLVSLLSGIALASVISGIDAKASGEWAVDRAFMPYREGWLSAIAKFLELVDGPVVIPWILAGIVVVGLVTHRGWAGILLMLIIGLAWLPGHFAKILVIRNRPTPDLEPVIVYPDQMSFPSGHTGMAAAMALGFLLAWKWHGHRVRPWMTALAWTWIVLVGVSRVYSGAHYPLDVLGGFLLAFGTYMLLSWPFTKAFDYGQRHFWHFLRSPGVEPRRDEN